MYTNYLKKCEQKKFFLPNVQNMFLAFCIDFLKSFVSFKSIAKEVLKFHINRKFKC